ncbi:hypothetical protein AQ505_13465 [Pedobacter sp. PACM 27299]|uniref:PD-(D/E)XK nuclease family protein n=1 Tax=Pedobacter sp. PACM 27299 TaxID=1727164 RepID=UPI00070608EB|nr:PD-(D/E)XK nuclease family protein [Pedobacter sp. PACM 27299]ALL06418.1 hypothetical protein AQ505_13465 [Pedobacter sp. PACM 27299]
MTENIEFYEELLNEFDKQPKIVLESTYLELCRYPSSRFEEICSRLLCFYFDPTNEHNFQNLFIDSLLQIIAPNNKILYKNDQIQVINELNSEGKRLDILIKSPDMVIGIENKINASVYNPLEIYSNQIALYGKKNVFKLILTVRSITNKYERDFIYKNNFLIVTYTDLFNQIKQNIGDYIFQGNQKYLLFMYDFIKTIENMTGETYENNKLSHFFSSNAEKIDNLIALYTKYNERVLKVQQNRISELIKLIKFQTNDDRWWIWEGWDLGYDAFNNGSEKKRIGIEASYEILNNNPLSRFKIYITTWKIKDFAPYEDRLTELFPNNYLDKTTDGRVYLHMEVIEDDDQTLIIEKLDYYYCLLSKIVNETES